MSDIVARLRMHYGCWDEAAAELERLQAALRGIRELQKSDLDWMEMAMKMADISVRALEGGMSDQPAKVQATLEAVRKRGKSRLVYDKSRRTIVIVRLSWWHKLWDAVFGAKKWS